MPAEILQMMRQREKDNKNITIDIKPTSRSHM